MKHAVCAALIVALVGITSCRRGPTTTAIATMNTQQLVEAARQAAHKAQSQHGQGARRKKKEWAETGRAFANRCVEIAPRTAACYYWRAVNTGLYHSVKIRGYQDGLRRMLEDCQRTIDLGDPGYDHGGPYRIPGQIFTRLPQTGGRPDSLIRDLEKAEAYLQRAIVIAPDYPENHVALARNLYLQDRYAEALRELAKAQKLSSAWRTDSAYREWQDDIESLRSKLDRHAP